MEVLLFPLVLLYHLSELLWLGVLLLFPIWLLAKRLHVGIVALLVCWTVLGLHATGFKVWGSEHRMFDLSRSLNHPTELILIEKTGSVTFGDGQKLKLYGVHPIISLDCRAHEWLVDEQAVSNHHWRVQVFREHSKEPILAEVTTVKEDAARINFKRRVILGCGNSAYPRLFPDTANHFVAEDLGKSLVRAGAATPDQSIENSDPAYWAELIRMHEISLQR